MANLTSGFCELVHAQEDVQDVQPVLQILSIKKINAQNNSGQDRYRVILSDGKFFIQSMLATQLNELVTNKDLDKNVVVKLTEFVTNAVQGRKLVIILKIEVVARLEEKVGNPQNMEQHATTERAAGAQGVSGGQNGGAAPGGGSRAPAANAAPTGGARGGARPPNKSLTGKDMGALYPIEGLSPYQNKWTIKARVTQRSDIKHWQNAKGEGKLFSVTLMDESGEIRATGFNDQVDAFYELLQEGKVFFITRARVNIAKKQYSNVNNEYELTFGNETEIEPCDDDSVPKVKYNFVSIGDLGERQKDETCDVIGVVKEIYELGSVTSKATQKPFAKRDLQLVDQSGQAVRLTLWGKQAESFSEDQKEPIIAFKGVKVGDFGGRSLSMFSGATMAVEPDIPEAHSLRGWYEADGRNRAFTAYSNQNAPKDGNAAQILPDELKTLGQVKDEQLGMSDKVDFFTTSATIAFIKSETFAYPACANPDGCNKKVVDDGSGWLCEKCNLKFPQPIWRYILQINLMDHAGTLWVTAFNEVAEQVMGVTANDLHKLKDEGEDNKLNSYFQAAMGKTFTFQMTAKQDSYNDQPRVRYQCRRAAPPDYAADSAHLIQLIEAL
ncbi:hypothetical protein DB88DRAFT_450919 [Papiliotrema laurentii]|uniref:Replication protein A subunit n=1 Tax=Papiliotrema laurentii TaxID=5418 RepID=A0AAD9L6H4_PAPLA|nr:hypothetical protein DB88DRAFT_450919 [Papiliotrema laurentii]